MLTFDWDRTSLILYNNNDNNDNDKTFNNDEKNKLKFLMILLFLASETKHKIFGNEV